MKTPEEFLKAEQIEDCELQVGNVVLLSYPPQVPVKKLSQLLTDFASQSKPQLNIDKIVSGIVDSLGDTSEGNDYHIHSVNGNRWITHKEIGSGEPLKQWLKSEIEKHIEQSKPEEIDVKNAMLHVFDNFNNNLSRNEVEKRIDDYLAYQTRLKTDTKTVDAVEWINVKDKLPQDMEEVMFSNVNIKDLQGNEVEPSVITGYYLCNGVFRSWLSTDNFTATYWMPLPKPPTP